MKLPIRPTTLAEQKAKRVYVFEEKSDLDHYDADAYTVRCVDDRFWRVFKKFLKNRGIKKLDPKTPAGAAKVFSSPVKEGDKDYNLRELDISINLHHVKKVMLFNHHACGAYGGFSAFDNDPDKEFQFHASELRKAREAILQRFPNLVVETYFIDGSGIIQTN